LILDTLAKLAINACTFTQSKVNLTGMARGLSVVIVVGLVMLTRMEPRIFLH
jgi:hypothetical protein